MADKTKRRISLPAVVYRTGFLEGTGVHVAQVQADTTITLVTAAHGSHREN